MPDEQNGAAALDRMKRILGRLPKGSSEQLSLAMAIRGLGGWVDPSTVAPGSVALPGGIETARRSLADLLPKLKERYPNDADVVALYELYDEKGRRRRA